MLSNPDRFGNERPPSYQRPDFILCPTCKAEPGVKRPDPACPSCGGYGEVPRIVYEPAEPVDERTLEGRRRISSVFARDLEQEPKS